MPELKTNTREELRQWVSAQASMLQRPCVVLLNGNVGAGKTQVVRWFCEALGAVDVASPTFAIHHEYNAPAGKIDHVDLYRVTSDSDLEASGFWDLLSSPQALLFVEWSARLPEDVWPPTWMALSIDLQKDSESDAARVLNWRVKRP